MGARGVVVTTVWMATAAGFPRAGITLLALVPLGAVLFVALGVPSRWPFAGSRRTSESLSAASSGDAPPRDTEVLATLMELQLIVRGDAVRIDDDVDPA